MPSLEKKRGLKSMTELKHHLIKLQSNIKLKPNLTTKKKDH